MVRCVPGCERFDARDVHRHVFFGEDPYKTCAPNSCRYEGESRCGGVLSVVRGPQQFLEAANRATMAVKQPFIHMVHKNLESDKVLDHPVSLPSERPSPCSWGARSRIA